MDIERLKQELPEEEVLALISQWRRDDLKNLHTLALTNQLVILRNIDSIYHYSYLVHHSDQGTYQTIYWVLTLSQRRTMKPDSRILNRLRMNPDPLVLALYEFIMDRQIKVDFHRLSEWNRRILRTTSSQPSSYLHYLVKDILRFMIEPCL